MDDPVEPPAGFEAVAAEPRVRILHALAEHHRRDPEDPFVGFAELRKAAGIRDSGNFNYHLDRLLGRFVQKHEAGYALANAGMLLVAAIASGSYEGDRSLAPTPIGEDCPLCGEPVRASGEGGMLEVGCRGDHALSYPVPPHVLDEEGLDAAVEFLVRRAHAELSLTLAGRCPLCAGGAEPTLLEPEAEAVAPTYRAVCDRCANVMHVPAGLTLVQEPAVAAYFDDHGLDVRSDPVAMLELASESVVTDRASDPTRVTVELERGCERLRAVVDGDARVVEVEREG